MEEFRWKVHEAVNVSYIEISDRVKYPCKTCKREMNCWTVMCMSWRAWFLEKWSNIHIAGMEVIENRNNRLKER